MRTERITPVVTRRITKKYTHFSHEFAKKKKKNENETTQRTTKYYDNSEQLGRYFWCAITVNSWGDIFGVRILIVIAS